MGGSGPAHPTGGTLDEVLEHYGVKGMRWGVRRSSSSSSDSEDAMRAKASRAKIKRGDTGPLSNKELQDLVTRMNLEQQYSRLSGQPSSAKGAIGKFVADTLISVGKSEATKLAANLAAKQVASLLKK